MAEFEFDLRDIFRIARRRKWIIIFAPLVVATLTYMTSTAPPAVYSAQSVVKISRVAANMQALLVEALSWYEGDNIATQSQIIESRKIAASVALRLAEQYPDFQVMGEIRGEIEEDDYDALEERVLNNPTFLDLVDQITVLAERIESSDTVSITSEASSAQLAIDVANFTALEYMNYNVAERNAQIREAVRFIQGRLQETEAELAEAERRLEEFKRDYRVVLGLDITESGNIQERIDGLGRTIVNLEQGVRQLESLPDITQYLSFSPAMSEVVDPLISQLEQQMMGLIVQINQSRTARRQLLTYKTEQSKDVQQNLLEKEELETRGNELIRGLIRRYVVIREGLAERQRSLVELQGELAGIPEATSRLGSLERQVALKTESLNLFQRRLQDAEIQQASEIREVSIVEQASFADVLPEPSIMLKTLAGLMVGIMLGGVFAFILESMDTSIGTIDDVEEYVKLPVLGVIPHLDLELVKKKILIDEMGGDVSPDELNRMAGLCTHFAPTEPISEAFRSMRAQLEVPLKSNGWKTLMVTSSVLQEGKTNTATNLAVVFGQSGQKTLLIDTDFRRPSIHKVFGLPQSPGLSEVLLGMTDWQSAVQSMDDLILGKMGLKNSHVTPGLDYLYFLTSGRRVNNPAELLSLDKVKGILPEMCAIYDIIIVDISPVLPVAEASQLAPGVDATLLCYQIGRIGREVVTRTKTRLETVGANVIGLVMNDIEAEIYHTRDYEYDGYKYKYEDSTPEEAAGGPLGRLKAKLLQFTGRSSVTSILKKPPEPPRQKPPTPGSKTQPSTTHPPSSGQEFDDIMKLTDDEE